MCKRTLLTLGTSFHCEKCTLDSWTSKKKRERRGFIFSTHGNVTVAGINILNFYVCYTIPLIGKFFKTNVVKKKILRLLFPWDFWY